jgi:hypothetical protein
MRCRWNTRCVPANGFGFRVNTLTFSPGTSTVSAETTPTSAAPTGVTSRSEFGRTAMAILATMVLLIVALTGILLETTWRNPGGAVEVLPADPGSFARR